MFHTSKRKLAIALILLATCLLCGSNALASKEIRFASVSWTGVTVKTDLGMAILDSLGYETSKSTLSVPIVYNALHMGDADIFLGNWMPTMTTIADKYFAKGTVIKYMVNMPGAKYTLAAPSYVVDGGLKDFSDIAKYAEQLDHKIYGLEPGNDGNLVINTLIENNIFGLGDFKLIETSEPIMLSEIKSLVQQEKWAVFLGWSPHYMNQIIDMKYLTGSTAETFGENDGTATIYTNIRKGFAEEQPNVAKFLKNFTFPISMMNEIAQTLQDNHGMKHADAGMAWLKQHPDIYQAWLEGVKTVDGKPALAAFEAYLQTK
jgi:glycine betaine/proline transport system substrate-binding protein